MSNSDNIRYVPAESGYYVIEDVEGELIKGGAVLAWQIEIIQGKDRNGDDYVKQHVQPVTLIGFSDSQYIGIIEPSGRVNEIDGGEYESLEEFQKMHSMSISHE